MIIGFVEMENGGLIMARMPEGWVITVKADKTEVRIQDLRELVTCKHCWKRWRAICPMAFYWDSHMAEAEDDCFCAFGEYRRDEMD